MITSIDLLIVDTQYKNVICYAPRNTVKLGDTVITDIGTGKVTDTMFTYSEDDVYKFFKRNMDIIPVKSVITPINYEGMETE